MNSLLSVQTVKSLLMTLILSVFISSTAIMADDFYQTGNMGYNQNWTSSSFWKSLRTGSNGSPTTGNNYYSAGSPGTEDFTIRSVVGNNSIFNGSKLYVGYSATYDSETDVVTATLSQDETILALKSKSTTVYDLYLGNGVISNSLDAAQGKIVSVYGKITVEGGDKASIDPLQGGRTFNLESILAGTGTLTLRSAQTAGGIINLKSTANTYSGKLQVGSADYPLLVTANLTAGSFNNVSELNVYSSCVANIVGVASDLPVNTVFSGAGAINISGTAGTVTLNTDNSDYSGALTVNTVSLAVTNPAALGTGTVTNNSQLQFNLATDGSYGQVISGTGAVTKSGAGTLTLSGANTFTGGMTISEGEVSVATGSTSLGAGALTLNNGATLIITGGDSSETLAISGAATLNGTLDLSNYLTTWNTGSTYTLMTANSIDSTEGLNLSGVGTGWGWEKSESGSSILLKYTSGTLGWNWTATTGSFMTATNWENNEVPVATSDVTINNEGGVAQINENATVKTVTLGKASNLQFTAGNTLTAETMTMEGVNQTLNLTGGNLTLTNAPAFNINNSDTGNASTLTLSTGTYANVLSGNTNLTKTGADTLTLSAANTYTGATTVSEGTLALTVDDAIASSTSVTNNAAITFAATSQTFNALTGTGTITGSGALTLANPTATYTGTINGTGTVEINNSTATAWNGTISGIGAVTKTGAGTLTLSGTNTFTGGMTISEGKVSVATGSTGLGSGALTLNNGATLIITGGDSFETLAISGAATLNGTLDLSNYLSTWNTGSTYTLMTAGSIVNTDDLTLSGVGTGWGWELSGASILLKYTSGTLGWNWTATTGSFMTATNWENNEVPVATSDVTINNEGGVAQIDSNATVKTVTLGKASNLQFTAGNTLTAETMTMEGVNQTLNLTGGSLTLTNAPAFNINNSDTGNASTLTLSTGTYANVLSGNTNLTKTGADTLTLSAANTYTGATTVSEGTLALTVDDAIASSTSVTNNAAITFAATAQTLNALTGTGTITGSGALTLVNPTATYTGTINGTGSVEINNSTATAWNGTIANTVSVTTTGSGALTLSTAQTYTGTTTVNAGSTVNLTNEANLNKSSSVVVNGTLDYSAYTGAATQTLNNLTGSGAITGANDVNLELCCNTAAVEGVKYTGTINAGSATITKTGTGRLKLYNNDSANQSLIAGSLVVSTGRLDIQGWLKSGLTVQANAIFSPGNSIGTTNVTGDYTLEDGGKLLLELGGTGSFDYDMLIVDGDIDFQSGSVIQLALSGVRPTDSGTFDLVTSTGSITYGETFDWNSILTSAGMSLENWSLTGTAAAITLAYTKGITAPVPEPSTWALLILGALGLMYFRRKK